MHTIFKLGLAYSFGATLCASAAPPTKIEPFNDNDPFADENEVLQEPREQITTQVEKIEISLEQFSELTFGDNIHKTGTQLRLELNKLIEKNQATLLDSTLVASTSGTVARTESVFSLIYPTEYNTPEIIPQQVNAKGTKTDAAASAQCPTVFEERPVGYIVELQATSGATTSIELEDNSIYYTGSFDWGTWKDDKAEANVSMVNFYVNRTKTGFTVSDGDYYLASVQSPKNSKGKLDPSRKILTFGRSISKVAKSTETPKPLKNGNYV